MAGLGKADEMTVRDSRERIAATRLDLEALICDGVRHTIS